MPMQTLSATDVAIGIAIVAGTLEMMERPSRFGGTYIAISDDVGLIEVALSRAEADQRISSVRARAEFLQ